MNGRMYEWGFDKAGFGNVRIFEDFLAYFGFEKVLSTYDIQHNDAYFVFVSSPGVTI